MLLEVGLGTTSWNALLGAGVGAVVVVVVVGEKEGKEEGV